jgi:hypothetical protein
LFIKRQMCAYGHVSSFLCRVHPIAIPNDIPASRESDRRYHLTAKWFQKDFLPTLRDDPPEEPGAIKDTVLECWRAFCLDGMRGTTTFVLLRSASE